MGELRLVKYRGEGCVWHVKTRRAKGDEHPYLIIVPRVGQPTKVYRKDTYDSAIRARSRHIGARLLHLEKADG